MAWIESGRMDYSGTSCESVLSSQSCERTEPRGHRTGVRSTSISLTRGRREYVVPCPRLRAETHLWQPRPSGHVSEQFRTAAASAASKKSSGLRLRAPFVSRKRSLRPVVRPDPTQLMPVARLGLNRPCVQFRLKCVGSRPPFDPAFSQVLRGIIRGGLSKP